MSCIDSLEKSYKCFSHILLWQFLLGSTHHWAQLVNLLSLCGTGNICFFLHGSLYPQHCIGWMCHIPCWSLIIPAFLNLVKCILLRTQQICWLLCFPFKASFLLPFWRGYLETGNTLLFQCCWWSYLLNEGLVRCSWFGVLLYRLILKNGLLIWCCKFKKYVNVFNSCCCIYVFEKVVSKMIFLKSIKDVGIWE